MQNGEFPVGHPTVRCFEKKKVLWTRPSDHNYRGLLTVKVEAPEKLSIPLLPYRSTRGILLFPLCGACSEEMPLGKCEHVGSERHWWGTYSHFELNEALRLNYKVHAVNEVDIF